LCKIVKQRVVNAEGGESGWGEYRLVWEWGLVPDMLSGTVQVLIFYGLGYEYVIS
jgi:hypothetical protein